MTQLSHSIENSEIDFEIKKIFSSTRLAKKFFCYQLNGESYDVLVIHNPEKVELTSKVTYNTLKHGSLSFVASCKKKVCIFVDKKAPRALIKHISKFHNLSWWGRRRNFFVSNGSKIQNHCTEKKRFSTKYKVYTYTPCSWYEAMVNATP